MNPKPIKMKIHPELINVVTVFSTFIAAIVSIVGNTWNKEQKGIKKLTATGRVAFILALISLFLAFVQVKQKNKKVISAQKLTSIASGQMKSETDEIIYSLVILIKTLDEDSQRNSFREIYSDSLELNSFVQNNIVAVEKFDTIVLDTLIKGMGLLYENRMMWEYLSNSYKEIEARINQTLNVYSSYIPEEVLIKLDDLFNDNYFEYITELLPILMKNSDNITREQISFVQIKYYFMIENSFINKLNKLRSNLDNYIRN